MTIPEIFAAQFERTGGNLVECIRAVLEADALARRRPPVRGIPDHARRIIATVALFGGVTSAEIVGPARHKDLVPLRHDAMEMIRELTGSSYPHIGRSLGFRDHATVIAGCKNARLRAIKNPEAWAKLKALCEEAIGIAVDRAARDMAKVAA